MVATRRNAANESPYHLLIRDDLVRPRGQKAIYAPDPERMFEGDSFPPRADCHDGLSQAAFRQRRQ